MRGNEAKLKILENTPPWEWPEGTREMLLGVLRDERSPEADLLLAAELAGDLTVIDDEMVDALLAILRSGDRPDVLRGQAAIALGPVLEYADVEEFEEAGDVPISEHTFHGIQELLRKLYTDTGVPKDVRRRILEASVHSPRDWHPDAVRASYSSDDAAWRLTAVFCMSFIRGFEEQILEALKDDDPEIEYEAVRAGGNWQVDAAWPHVAALLTAPEIDKPLLLAAIESAAAIRPGEAAGILDDLADSDDEDVVAAVEEAWTLFHDEEADDDNDSPF
jgi:hypothetical protein